MRAVEDLKPKVLRLIVFVQFFGSIAVAQTPLHLQTGPHVPRVLIVGERTELVGRATLLSRFTLRKRLPDINVSIIEVADESQIDSVQDALVKSGQFRYVEKDFLAHYTGFVPNDPDLPLQWAIPIIQAEQAWASTLGSPSVIIGIIDSGIDPTHEDLASKLVPGYDFLNDNSIDTSDDNGHGTAVAAAAAAATDNGVGMVGVCPFCKLMPLRAGTSSGVSYSNIAAALMYAAEHGVRIANVSAGATQPSSLLQEAVTYAWNNNTLVFAATGDSGNSVPYYPAACSNVVAVGGTNQDDTLATISTYGPTVTIVAPGHLVLSAVRGGGYAYWSGTSISSPIAAGTAGLAVSVNPTISNSNLLTLLETNSDDLGTPGFDNYFGWGRVNAARLVSAAIKATGNAPLTLSPSQANILQAQSQQFSIAGSLANATVSWSITPDVGSISQTGLYTAPAAVTTPTAVTVFAVVNHGPVLVADLTVAPPVPSINSVVNGADFKSEPISPGAWISILGQNLGQTATAAFANTYTLGRASVFICGISTILSYNSGPVTTNGSTSWQLNALMPAGVAGRTSCPVTVTVTDQSFTQGQTSQPASVAIASGVMELFQFTSSAGSLPIITHADYSLVGPATAGLTPAKPKETVIAWGTGDCSTAGLTVGGTSAAVAFSGQVEPGLCQVNFIVPNSPTGSNQLKVSTSPNLYSLWVSP